MSVVTKFFQLLSNCWFDFLKQKYPVKSNRLHLERGLQWLCRAQDVNGDGGVSAWYSLLNGWQQSYIETTGYIINTYIAASRQFPQLKLLERAEKMGNFLIEMQLPSGGFRTSVPNAVKNSPPTVFNSGQDLLGLVELYEVTKKKKYLVAAEKCADFLVSIQEDDGSWIKNTYGSVKHTYHTRVAWGILRVWQHSKKTKYLTAAKKNLSWAVQKQNEVGWFSQNQLPPPNPEQPYTHTIAYAIEGLLWSGLILKEKQYLHSAEKASLPLARYFLKHKFMPGTFDQEWRSNDRFSCLTGDAQMSLVWLELFKLTRKKIYKIAADKMIMYLKSQQPTEESASKDIRGSLKGSSPIYGDLLSNSGYCRLAYLNWSTKFFLDALLTQNELRRKK